LPLPKKPSIAILGVELIWDPENSRISGLTPGWARTSKLEGQIMSTADGDARRDQDIGDLDVAVVGGGIAGCYTAWRLRTLEKQGLSPDSPLLALLNGKEHLDVGLFEYSDRLGGRLWSVALKGLPNEFVDFGGMRFYKEMHIVWNLIQCLGLEAQAIPFPVSELNNFVYVRGRHMRTHQLSTQLHELPYRLRYLERGKTADQLLDFVSETAVAGFVALWKQYSAEFSAKNWEEVTRLREEYERRKRSTRIDGRTVYDMSWWELQTRLLSHEAFEFILDTSGYDVTNTNGNAAHSLDQNFFAPEKAGFFRLSRGFEKLPDKLHEAYHNAGGRTYLLHRLVRFSEAPETVGGPYDMLFHERTDTDEPVGGGVPLGQSYTKARAKLVILAMPLRALRLLDQDNFFFQPRSSNGVDRKAKLDAAMGSVLNVNAFKLFLAYHRPWWKQTGVAKGQSVTDLPLRQCYYWTNGVAGSPDSPTDSIVMATYNSGIAVPYWQSLQSGLPFGSDAAADEDDPFGGRAFAHINRALVRLGGQAVVVPPIRPIPRTATKGMVARAHAQLMEMHGVTYAPEPYDAHFQDWNVDPFGGGWHQWKTSTNENELIPYMQQPLKEERVFVVGECWSDSQGWVQGALNTSEAMLQDMLGLSWPNWLSSGGTWLGPRKGRKT
jgi:monoamine oxidase